MDVSEFWSDLISYDFEKMKLCVCLVSLDYRVQCCWSYAFLVLK
jgi:hypothetical protein